MRRKHTPTAITEEMACEKKLIALSLIVGLLLLGILVWTGNSALTPGH